MTNETETTRRAALVTGSSRGIGRAVPRSWPAPATTCA